MDRSRPTAIPGVETFHRREQIEALSYPIDGPQSRQDVWDTFALHFTAADDLIDGDPGEFAHQLDDYIGNIQRYYEEKRKYSVGYQMSVDWLGGAWELRSFDINCAANRGWNDRTFAVLCLVDGDDPLTDEAIRTINALWAEAERRCGRKLTLRPHSEIGSTHCPGNGIRAQIAAGRFRPETLEKADDDMLNWLKKPKRIYDSRKTGGPLKVGETRVISHGKYATVCAANVTVISNQKTEGYISVSGVPGAETTSITNLDADGVANGTFMGATPDGKLYIYFGGPHRDSKVDFVVDLSMYGTGNVVDD